MQGGVEFHFELDDRESEGIYSNVSSSFFSLCLDDPLVQTSKGVLTLRQYCFEAAAACHEALLHKARRQTLPWETPKDYSIVPGWVKTSTITQMELSNGVHNVPPNLIAFGSKNPIHPGLTRLSVESLDQIINSRVIAFVNANLPKCIFWKYADNFLLPSSVSISEFSQNPDCCVPLKHMFELAGIASSSIAEAIATAVGQSQHRYMKLLSRVSEAATRHVQSVWHDHKSLKIELRPNGDLLVPLVTESEVRLDMASRSDGFKRFASFLLMISARVRTTEMKGVLLLVDEPEIALHPSGARSLSRELIQIGATNTVVYSTHSIFMIDKEKISRHLIVEKKNEITVASVAEKSKMQDEEVLYAAIGYSIFEALKPCNVIFEGWRDKEIFRVACQSLQTSNADFREKIKIWGAVFAEGVKDIKHVSRVLELASRHCLIISDSDRPALEKKRDYEDGRSWGTWLTLKEVLGEGFETGEDLFSLGALVLRCNKFSDAVGGVRKLASDDFPVGQACWPIISKWALGLDLQGIKPEQLLHQLKNHLYKDLTRSDFRDEVEKLAMFVVGYDFE